MDSVLRLYYAKYLYLDTLRLKYGKIYVQDSVQQNKIIWRSWGADLLIPVEKTTVTVKEPGRNQIYFGAGAVYSRSITPSVGLMIKTKRDRIYGVSLGISNALPVYGGHIYIKL